MKNTVQARKNGSAPRIGRQTKSPNAKRPAAKQKPESTVTFVIFGSEVSFDSDDKSLEAVVEVLESLFRRMDQARKQLKISWQEFFEQAMRAKLESSGVRVVKGGAQ